jgi:hypothetical protein
MVMRTLLLFACTSPPPGTPAAPPPAESPSASVESSPHGHGAAPPSGPHGGIVQTVGEVQVEALMMPAGVMVYLSAAHAEPVEGYSGTAVIGGPAGKSTVDLVPMGDHLHAATTLVYGQPASAVITLERGGKEFSATFQTSSVGLPSHDHTALHGGQVGMWGNYHVEYLAVGGEYRVWITDATRNAAPGVTGATVKEADRATALALDPNGAWIGKASDAGTHPATIEVTADGVPFSLPFQAGGTHAH